jgi:hypothetical protein
MSFIVHVNAIITCPHSAPVLASTSNRRVFVSNMRVVTRDDTFEVKGCQNRPPCTATKWTGPRTRVLVNGSPVILKSSNGYCIPTNGPPNVLHTQYKVSGK